MFGSNNEIEVSPIEQRTTPALFPTSIATKSHLPAQLSYKRHEEKKVQLLSFLCHFVFFAAVIDGL